MSMLRWFATATVCGALVVLAAGQAPATAGPAADGARATVARQSADDLDDLLAEVRRRRIERSIRTLAGFGTRHTLSSQDDPRRGIGAARDWIFEHLKRSAAASGGRMTVELQSFIQQPVPRVPEPTRITNVVATLRGTQPESADRMYVVSGHYDSRCSDPLDAVCDAPGANDDASGVAAVLELARVMAKRPFEATIVFMAVAGEEQGLLGAEYYAEQAKQRGWNIAGMFTNDIIGSSLGQNGVRNPRTVRLFAEGTPIDETPEEAAVRETMGGENDSPARQLARFVKDVAERPSGMTVRIVYRRDRFLRGGDHSRSSSGGTPRPVSPKSMRTTGTSTRMSASRMACSTAT